MTAVSDPLDPIAEARRQWEAHGWGEVAPAMAAVTSVMRAQQLLLSRVEEHLGPFELTFARFELLRLLAFTRHGELPLGKLGDRLQVHATSVTNAVNRLEVQGFVRRQPHPTDGRTTLAVITDAGREVVERATLVLNAEVFVDIGLGDREVGQLFRLLEKVRRSAGGY
jgi:DNA-binding MarR family transcriptional regulator